MAQLAIDERRWAKKYCQGKWKGSGVMEGKRPVEPRKL
jgi:hypothetical protein